MKFEIFFSIYLLLTTNKIQQFYQLSFVNRSLENKNHKIPPKRCKLYLSRLFLISVIKSVSLLLSPSLFGLIFIEKQICMLFRLV